MDYTIKSHPTKYRGTLFRSRLEARWAAFFDLAGWKWEYEPLDLHGWTPDFFVEFRCGHSDCSPTHSLLVEVKPYLRIEDFNGHPCMSYPYGVGIPADASAAFGNSPDVTYWEMAHGAGGGIEHVDQWVMQCVDDLWAEAGNLTRYKPNRTVHLESVSPLDLMLEINRLRAERSKHD